MKDIRYRRDNRTVKQFAEDIKHGHRVERDIIDRYVAWVKAEYGVELTIEDNGVDNTGKLLDEANTDADFRLNGKPVEVKFNNHHLNLFHIKKGQLHSYIKQQATILWVNGYETDNPLFTVVSTKKLTQIAKRPVVSFKGWGGKKCYRIEADEFQWKVFK